MRDLSWLDDAACGDYAPAVVEQRATRGLARAICAACPVARECAADDASRGRWADALDPTVRAGLTGWERLTRSRG